MESVYEGIIISVQMAMSHKIEVAYYENTTIFVLHHFLKITQLNLIRTFGIVEGSMTSSHIKVAS